MLQVQNMSFAYNQDKVLNDITFSVSAGENIAIIGESGCGKSTLLKLLYGIHDVNQGAITYNGKLVQGPKEKLIPGDDAVKYLAQDFGLMPYITVAENVGKFVSNVDKSFKMERVAELLSLVQMTEYSNVKAQHLSGGQQQRTALAMTLALQPSLLLLDEPFSQIDSFRTNILRRSLFHFCKQNNITCIVATHDNHDILPFADQVFVLQEGIIIRQGDPQDVYHNPGSYYTASLFGDTNIIPGHVLGLGSADDVFVYPHNLVISDKGFIVIVKRSHFHGSHYLIETLLGNEQILFQNNAPLPVGTSVRLSLKK